MAISITGMRITAAEVTREKNEVPKGIGINMSINTVRQDGDMVEIVFTYRADYAENVGLLRLEGIMYVKPENKKQLDELVKGWKDKKKLDDEIAEDILNNINFACGAHGTLMARVVNLQPPMMPPRIKLDKSGSGASAA